MISDVHAAIPATAELLVYRVAQQPNIIRYRRSTAYYSKLPSKSPECQGPMCVLAYNVIAAARQVAWTR